MGKHKHSKSKKHKKEKKHKHKDRTTSSDSSEEWVEKELNIEERATSTVFQKHDDWMTLPTNFSSISNIDKRQVRANNNKKEKEANTYNPQKNERELNPFWKNGGDGLPKFQKPSDDYTNNYQVNYAKSSTSNWRKPKELEDTDEHKFINTKQEILSDTELNSIAAKLVKAEILGNTALIVELKEKLEKARTIQERNLQSSDLKEQNVILTETNTKGDVRPLRKLTEHGEYSGGSSKKQKLETHVDKQRIRYFPDDDKYSLKQMFENEKFSSISDSNKQFLEVASKIHKNDNLDDLFIDNIRRKGTNAHINKQAENKAINDHREQMQALDNCHYCLQSEKVQKHLTISIGETMYLTLPHHEPLTDNHCLLVPLRHVSCSTQLEENEWRELLEFRKSLTQMFLSTNQDIIFFETAMFLYRHPHMVLHGVPVPKEQGELAPIYFKKAIDESEMEWALNKKLVSLAGRDVRRAVPKGLPYFAVSFGMEEGFAHVIEDQRLFPSNFAQEIIGGILDIHHSKWRKPKPQNFEKQNERMTNFTKTWSEFNCTVNK